MSALPPAVGDAVARSPRRPAVRAALDWLVEAHPGLDAELAEVPDLLATLVAVLAASPALSRLLRSDPGALGVLRRLEGRPPPPEGNGTELVAWKRRELLRIAARDLTGRSPLEETGADLARMADTVLERARALVGPAAAGLALVAMGKAGARELNYASDVDVMFVGEGDPRPVLELARRAFRVDADLRPEGRNGPLTRTLESYVAYWERWAEAWERQALLKARPVSGPPELVTGFSAAAGEVVWGRPFTAEDLNQVRSMKARSEGEVARRGLTGREIKRGPGGIRDVEFSVQLLQLIHGPADPALRRPATLDALAELRAAGYVADTDASALESSYRFLRTVENRLQMAEEEQTHTVPAGPEERQWLGRVCGFTDDPTASAAERLDQALRSQLATARSVHERLFFRPLLEAFSARPERLAPGMTSRAVGERLAAFGFADTGRARAALAELTRGLTRSSRLMQALLPLMLEWLSLSPDPDLGLHGLRRLVGSSGSRRDGMVGLFRESPESARRLCLLLGTTPLAHDRIRRDPALLPRLLTDAGLSERAREELADQAHAIVGWRAEPRDRHRGLRLFKSSEEAAVMAADVLGRADVDEVGRRLAALAEAVLEAALEAVGPPVPMAVIGMGRFGGTELSYASDLDVLLVSADTPPGEAARVPHAEAAALRLLRFVNGETPARRIYTLDADLRPEGRDGLLARTMAGYTEYYRRWAHTWERQALLRARPVAGDAELGRRFMELAAEVTAPPATEEEVREIRRMKARVEKERIPPGQDPDFHLKLGRGSLSDVEWTVQLLQLTHQLSEPATLPAIDALVGAGAMTREDASALAESYRFCEHVRNRLFLVEGTAGDAFPTAPDRLVVLARSLDTTPSELRDHFRRVTRRARRVTERLFYGQNH
ncbi:MAG TPA: bifunctional [glutamine synthetase] adenylyltransferase/[glutamine synthetase]-adenylyl-L-tyrosine phosphorylase [Acidimicrobiales bacterium]|nr:bifunctional [glutamine synthetase] adenylyltransferase/[glutamine synthetase]-adenylyl-L-tyrosine phosphorylase [Acidimicrobiales bacterium]